MAVGSGGYRGEVQELCPVQRHHPRRIARLARTVPPLPKQTHRDHIGRHRLAKAFHIQDRHSGGQAHRIVIIRQSVGLHGQRPILQHHSRHERRHMSAREPHSCLARWL